MTVVIAVHNAYDELARCFDSVLANTPEPHELLLIDDASTDDRVGPLLEGYAERSEPRHRAHQPREPRLHRDDQHRL